MSISNRIALIIKNQQLTNSAFADKIGVQRSNISHILSGRSKPGLDFLEKVLETFPRVNAEWLVTGKVKQEAVSEMTPQATTSLFDENKTIEKVNIEPQKIQLASPNQMILSTLWLSIKTGLLSG